MSGPLSSYNRDEIRSKLGQEEYDLLIIGGGITGAGIALDASSRGMSVALVEMQDFAAGTSSRSSKLIHGGLRYLKKYEFKQVSQAGRERAIVYENGPHVTTPEWMILPVYQDAEFGMFMTSVGLRMYDSLARVKKNERKKMLTKAEILRVEPKLNQEGLVGGGTYVEYRTDDARLTVEVMKEAANYGATVLNYMKFTEFMYENKKIVGAKTIDMLNGQMTSIRAKKIVNATGPWVDQLREKDQSLKNKQLHHTKGIHLVFNQSDFPMDQAVYFDTPDGRMVFIIPRDDKTYVGTTDTDYKGDLSNPRMTASDRDYVLHAINFIFPTLDIKESDIISSWAGIRPLIHEAHKSPSEISRKDEIWESDSGLLTIAGGKLTGYRKMAETIVNLLATKFKQNSWKVFSPCQTKKLPISGGHVGGSERFKQFLEEKTAQGVNLGLDKEIAYFLAKTYGSNIDDLFNFIATKQQEADRYGLPVDICAQVHYSMTHELACTPVDFFLRRTGSLLFDPAWVRKWKTPVITMMGEKLKWSTEQKETFRLELENQLHDMLTPIEEEHP